MDLFFSLYSHAHMNTCTHVHTQAALWCCFIADSLSMPVHWFYDTRALDRQFGGKITGVVLHMSTFSLYLTTSLSLSLRMCVCVFAEYHDAPSHHPTRFLILTYYTRFICGREREIRCWSTCHPTFFDLRSSISLSFILSTVYPYLLCIPV